MNSTEMVCKHELEKRCHRFDLELLVQAYRLAGQPTSIWVAIDNYTSSSWGLHRFSLAGLLHTVEISLPLARALIRKRQNDGYRRGLGSASFPSRWSHRLDPCLITRQMPRKPEVSYDLTEEQGSYRHLAIAMLDHWRSSGLGRRACQSRGANRDLAAISLGMKSTMFNLMKKELREAAVFEIRVAVNCKTLQKRLRRYTSHCWDSPVAATRAGYITDLASFFSMRYHWKKSG